MKKLLFLASFVMFGTIAMNAQTETETGAKSEKKACSKSDKKACSKTKASCSKSKAACSKSTEVGAAVEMKDCCKKAVANGEKACCASDATAKKACSKSEKKACSKSKAACSKSKAACSKSTEVGAAVEMKDCCKEAIANGEKACCANEAAAKKACVKTDKKACCSKAGAKKACGTKAAAKTDATIKDVKAQVETKTEELHACCVKAKAEGKTECCGKTLK